jgi:hypothetical protein
MVVHREVVFALTRRVDGVQRLLAAARIDARFAGLGHQLRAWADKLTVPLPASACAA